MSGHLGSVLALKGNLVNAKISREELPREPWWQIPYLEQFRGLEALPGKTR
jgi:hypothetical protein